MGMAVGWYSRRGSRQVNQVGAADHDALTGGQSLKYLHVVTVANTQLHNAALEGLPPEQDVDHRLTVVVH